MDYRRIEKWPSTRAEALAFQNSVAKLVRLGPLAAEPEFIAAVDTAYGRDGEYVYAAAVLTSFPEIALVERAVGSARADFPYVPGLLFFREGPAIIEALGKLIARADVLLIHGHGLAHPQRCGMASQLGVLFDRPSVGCCRKLLAGRHRPVHETKGSRELIIMDGQQVGVAYRSKDRVKPIFISPGHYCDLSGAGDLVVRNLRGYRLPEPLRLAHLFANKYKRSNEK